MVVGGPEDVTVAEGAQFELAVRAEGTGPLRYQWFGDNGPIQGWTRASMGVERAGLADSGRYSCEVVGPRGDGVVSRRALVTVQEQ